MWKSRLKTKLLSLEGQIKKIQEEFVSSDISKKSDGTLVTKLDLFLSEELENFFKEHLPSYTFYSEENEIELKFPAVIVDPIDGTRGLVDGTLESSISIAVMSRNDIAHDSFGIVYNPFNGYYIDSEMLINTGSSKTSMLKGMVSRSEYNDGLYEECLEEGVFILPMGSIAYKLGLLAGGMIDFVVTKKPKNIWDIAAGSILCFQSGYTCIDKNKNETTSLANIIEPPFLWCKKENKNKIINFLKIN